MKNFENVPKCLPIKTYSFLVLKERIEEKEQFHSYIITYGKIDSLNEKKKTVKASRLQGCTKNIISDMDLQC